MYKEQITTEELNQLPVAGFEGQIVVVDDDDTMSLAYDVLSREKYIGFDTETKPSFKKGQTNKVALLQLSTDTTAFLFRLNKKRFSPGIKEIFQNPEIIKIGASIRDDIRILQQVREFKAAGFVDLQHIVGAYGIKELSVRKMSGIILGFKVSKAQRLSNWEANTFTEPQKIYAATDAWVCRKMYLRLKGFL